MELALVGTAGALGADRAPGLLLSREADGRYTAMVKLRAGEEVAFEISQREVWIPEVDATGAPVPRHPTTSTTPTAATRCCTCTMGRT